MPITSTERDALAASAAVGLTIVAGAATFAIAARLASRTRQRGEWGFNGQTVIITGGGRGLGLALARRLAAERAHVVLVSRDRQELDRAKADIAGRGGSVQVIEADIRDEGADQRLVEEVIRERGRVDLLINNAGVIQMTPFDHATREDFEDSLKTHFWGPLYLIRACLPAMRRQHSGRILNISSIGGRVAVPHLIPYSAGKFALTALSNGLRAELARDGIVVTTATPGLMRTGSHRNVLVRGRHEQEAGWFGLLDATPITSMDVDDAAGIILDAVRVGKAQVTPGWQARAAWLLDAITPEASAAIFSAVGVLLPRPSAEPDAANARRSRELDLGWFARLLPTGAAVEFNQPVAADERG